VLKLGNGQRNVNSLIHEVLDMQGVTDTTTIYFYVVDNYRHAPSKQALSNILATSKDFEKVESNKRKVTLWQRRV
tara:strand:+ start:434 stop:658 length:225 start_codon:yes stop_codon:yes gene_type:complete